LILTTATAPWIIFPHQLHAHMVTRMDQSWLLASTIHGFSLRVWYVSLNCLPYVALLSLGGVPRVALLLLLLYSTEHTSLLLQTFHLLHLTQCTWREIRNAARVPTCYPSTLLLRLRLFVGTIHSAPLLLPSDIVHTELG
jgi:hypothetical protein